MLSTSPTRKRLVQMLPFGAVLGLAVLSVGIVVWEQGASSRVRDIETAALRQAPDGEAEPSAAGAVTVAPAGLAGASATQAVDAYDSRLFIDVSATAGVDFLHVMPIEVNFPFGAGVVIFDFNGDRLDDIYVTNTRGANALYRNEGDGTFTDVAAAAGVDDPGGKGNGGCAADYDNDGDRDLLVTSYGSLRLFRNVGDGTFADVTLTSIGDPIRRDRHMGCAWGDYDGDSFLDLVLVRHVHEDAPELLVTSGFTMPLGGVTLYHNDGDGILTDVTGLLGFLSVPQSMEDAELAIQLGQLLPGSIGSVLGAGFQPGWLDYDNDGDLDLYVVNDIGDYLQANVLWRNDGAGEDGAWSFLDISSASETGVRMEGMAIAAGDYDLDGWIDLYLTNIGDNILFNNNGDGLTFSPLADKAGVGIGAFGEMKRVSWAAMFFDYDNDGDEDLYVVSGYLGGIIRNPKEQPNALLQNNGDGTFADVSSGSGADDPGLGRGGGYLDFNNDGCLDLYFGNYRQTAKLLQNACSGNNWLVIDTVGTTSNRDGVGARITVIADGKSQIREVSAGSSSVSQNMLAAHFGLGPARLAEYVIIRWPSGKVQTLIDVAANQRLTATEPE